MNEVEESQFDEAIGWPGITLTQVQNLCPACIARKK